MFTVPSSLLNIKQLPKRPFLCAKIEGPWKSTFSETFCAAELCNSSQLWSSHFPNSFSDWENFFTQKIAFRPNSFAQRKNLFLDVFHRQVKIFVTTSYLHPRWRQLFGCSTQTKMASSAGKSSNRSVKSWEKK